MDEGQIPKNEFGFLKKLDLYAKDKLSEAHMINIIKMKYLTMNKEEIIKAYKYGYGYGIIAQFATKDLLERSNLPHSYSFVSKEGKTINKETKFSSIEIKNICEGSSIS